MLSLGKCLKQALPIVLIVGALGVASCGGESSEPTEAAESTPAASSESAPQDLVESAQEDGSVVWYTGLTDNVNEAVSNAFTERYGIQVDTVRLTSDDVGQRYSAEAAAGNTAADLVVTTPYTLIPEATKRGWMTPIEKADIPVLEDGTFPKVGILDDGEVVVQYLIWQLAYNTDEVEESEVPQTWQDVLDPRWSDRIVTPNPEGAAAYLPFWDLLKNEFGTEFLTAFGQQNPRIAESSTPAGQSLAAGEVALMLPAPSTLIEGLQGEGAPVDMVEPSINTAARTALGISSDAPHPNAARLFANFLLSEEGNNIVNEGEGTAGPYDEGGEEGGFPKGYVDPRPEARDNPDPIIDALDLH